MFERILRQIKNFLIPCRENDFRPEMMEGNFLFSIVIGLFVLRVVFLPFYLGFSKSLFFAEIVSGDIVEMLNEQRAGEGLSTLSINHQLNQAAYAKAVDMIEKDYFSHNSPDGKEPWSFIRATGYRYSVAGENLAIGFLDSSEVHEAWNNSPLHKRNLLDSRFEEIGVAVVNGDYNGSMTTVVVEMFGRPSASPILANTQPEPVIVPEEVPVPEVPVEQVAPAQQEVPLPEEVPVPEVPVIEPEVVIEAPVADPITEPDGVVNEKRFEIVRGSELIPSLEFNLMSFFMHSYDQIVRNIVFVAGGALVGIIAFDLLLISFTSSLQREEKTVRLKSFALKGFASVAALFFLGSLSKTFIIQFVPHVVEI